MGQTMKSIRKRLQQTALLATIVLCAAAAAACIEYLRRGGDMAALADAVLRTAQGEGMPRASRGDVRWEMDWSGAWDSTQSLQSWVVERFRPAPADDGPILPAVAAPGIATPDGSLPDIIVPDTFETTIIEPDFDAAVQVYFAPVRPGAAEGIKRVLLELIAGAQESVLVAAFNLGHEGIADALIEAHRSGLRVGIVSDSDYREQEAMQRVLAAGIEVRFDERSAFMHNKFVIVDSHTVWTGSTNLTNNGFFVNRNNAVVLRSPELAANFTVEFQEMFRDGLFGPRSPPGVPHPVLHVGPTQVRTLFAPEDDVISVITGELARARTHIDFMAYAFSCEDIAGAMAQGLDRGLAVRGLFERIHAGRDWSRDDYLAARGAQVFVCASPGKMHHKVIVIDRELVVTGSYNFSRNAAQSNDENVVLLRNAEIAGRFVDELDRLVLEATEGPV